MTQQKEVDGKEVAEHNSREKVSRVAWLESSGADMYSREFGS
jgi:hypothetical protein